jgi:hypothetical protein
MKIPAIVVLLIAGSAHAADDPRVSFLEQEVRNLHRQVDQLSRQVDRLTTRPDRPRTSSTTAGTPAGHAAAPDSMQWVDAARWKQLQPGMSELDVIGTLGPPTSMRTEDSARVLLYALEIGSSGFLGGSVVLRDRAVVEVRPPTLQ